MDQQTLTILFVGASFALYIGIAFWSRATTTGEFYVAGKGVNPILNGMATAADWMSAASFISMAGLIAFKGYDASVYLMGWTGGYVLLALALAPYLRKFGKFTVPEFIGERYYSKTACAVAVLCLLVASITYVIGQMKGVGVAFSRFLEVDFDLGVIIGMSIVFFYAVLGGMKGVTYTQVAQYCVLIFAYTVPAIFISLQLTDTVLPQLGFTSTLAGTDQSLMHKLDTVLVELGFSQYTAQKGSTFNLFCLTLSLMIGTAGLPHVIMRFFTVPRVKDARSSAGWALVFIAILYTTAPAVGAMAIYNLINTVQPDAQNNAATSITYEQTPDWVKNWENTGLLAWQDKNGDGRVQYRPGAAFEGKPAFATERGNHGERLVTNAPTNTENELYVDRDIIVLANPEIAKLPGWVIALVVAGGLAAALSTAAGLLLAIATAISHDVVKGMVAPNISDRQELMIGRIAMAAAIVVAGILGMNPPGFAAQVVALAFGLAASSLFPAIVLGIFSKRVNQTGAICGMLAGLISTLLYIFWFKGWLFIPDTAMAANTPDNWLLGIQPEAFGAVGALINIVVAIVVSRITAPVPQHIANMVDNLRIPAGQNASS